MTYTLSSSRMSSFVIKAVNETAKVADHIPRDPPSEGARPWYRIICGSRSREAHPTLCLCISCKTKTAPRIRQLQYTTRCRRFTRGRATMRLLSSG